MASPPVGPRPNRRAALNVTKTTKPKVAPRGTLSTTNQVKAPKKPVTKKATVLKHEAADDAARQEVAQRIVRKIFAEAGVSPERIAIGSEPRAESPVGTKTSRRRSGSSKVESPTSTSTQPTVQPAESVVMPSNANERLLSKAAALRAWYKQHFPRQVGLVCTVAGLFFSAIGGLSLIPFVGAMYPDWQSFQSALVCETLTCEQQSTTTSSNTSTQSSTQTSTSGTTQTSTTNTSGTTDTTQTTVIPSPSISFLTRPPSPLIGPTTIVVRAEYVTNLVVLAESRQTGRLYELPREGAPAGSDHTFVLAPAQFPAAEYDLRARGVALRDGRIINVTGPRFRVELQTQVNTAPATNTTDSTTSTSGSTATTTTTSAGEVVGTEATQVAPETTLEDEVVAPEVATTTPASAAATLSYVRPAPGYLAVTVLVPDAQAVEVYAQRLNATAPVLIGAARRVESNRWLLSYDTRSLPNGSYVLVGRVRTGRGPIDTPRVPLFVENRLTTNATTTTTRAVTETTETVERLAESDTPLPDRRTYTEVLPPQPAPDDREPVIAPASTAPTAPAVLQPVVAPLPITSVPAQLRPVVREQFVENADALNDLFKRYASAIQTNDEAMRTLIEDELAQKRTRIVEQTIARGERSVTASDLEQSLVTEFGRLKEQVETFENLLRERSGQNSATDQDSDGVSDHDEVTLYDTDPTQFDTDGDGASDGAEIMRGFDPLSSETEAIMTYTSPKEFGLVRDDVLTVAAVTPVIETDRERGTPPVQAEIRGTGIPNSFVTLFIFSSPTVVTVRTAADGSFVYQFDKELEDGSHEVYVAVTDNTGDIIAKSNPFTFVKEAEAFTVVDAATAAPVASSDPAASVSISQLYQVITAMVVLAFGLILLIFGVVMRREPTVTEATPTTEATT